ncbi:flagellin lysine-N-methylase [Brevibacillus dissolubilis]|uniref:flagellin lysine-N-methylase n=1 Tax=Brevibacillus dissolubilis TaxID=1844116 RepID=UPI001115F18D|nr:flagellin lysine-N-methylase [Brevibacillus dissolubilis]
MPRLNLVPEYMKNFSCTGSACEDTCCFGWTVPIDKKTFDKYKTLKDKKLKTRIYKSLRRNKMETSFSEYATIKMGHDGYCPHLNQDKLCSLQLKLGERFLSHVCSTYPREYNVVFGDYELSGAISCPEVARLALLNPDGMKFEKTDEKINTSFYDRQLEDESLAEHFYPLREFVIELLQNRTYTIPERLLLVGVFIRKLSAVIELEEMDEIPDIIASFKEELQGGSVLEALADLPVRTEAQFVILQTLTSDYVNKWKTEVSPRYFQYYRQINEVISGSVDRYQEAYAKYYAPYMEQHEYLMENYLVNYTFTRLFPFMMSSDVWDDYVGMVLHYALVKMHLIGVSAYYQKLDHELAINMIYSYSRLYEHNSSYFEWALEELKKDEFDTMEFMVYLIKNE